MDFRRRSILRAGKLAGLTEEFAMDVRMRYLVTFALLAVSCIGQAADLEVTGQHRGYTNHQLYLRLDNDKEMTFIVRIPGDKDEKWQNDFQTLSRITVTYHDEAEAKYPIATAIRVADSKR
jgi:hypothetical protein